MVEFDDRTDTLRCRGDEDRCTQGARRKGFTRALRAGSNVTADLSQLVFADPSVMLDLAALARRLRVRGGALRIHHPQPQIMTLIELTGLDRQPGIKLEPSPILP